MKYILVLSLLMAACDIEGAIGNASQRCEDEIAKIIQSIESTCLTKDELMDIIDSVRAKNDQRSDYVGSD
tara:strand:+ start:612 stop:821 length:210 start_codon:yes stop_codon:yes gene_type:complete